MNTEPQTTPKDGALRTSLSLFPKHEAVVKAFQRQDNRSYSNAVQTIIEQWAREHGFAHLLEVEELAA